MVGELGLDLLLFFEFERLILFLSVFLFFLLVLILVVCLNSWFFLMFRVVLGSIEDMIEVWMVFCFFLRFGN